MTQSVVEQALALPCGERLELAEKIWESLAQEGFSPSFEDRLVVEVESRRERFRRGEGQLHDWDCVRTELNELVERVSRS